MKSTLFYEKYFIDLTVNIKVCLDLEFLKKYSLKEGLLQLGHDVVLLSTGDDFKYYPSDILVRLSIFSKPFFKLIAKVFDKLFNVQLIELEYYYKSKIAIFCCTRLNGCANFMWFLSICRIRQ